MVGAGEKSFQIKALRCLENGILKLVSASTVFHKRAILLIFEAEFTESVLDFLSYPESNLGLTMVGPPKKFSKWRYSDFWKTQSSAMLIIFEAEFT